MLCKLVAVISYGGSCVSLNRAAVAGLQGAFWGRRVHFWGGLHRPLSLYNAATCDAARRHASSGEIPRLLHGVRGPHWHCCPGLHRLWCFRNCHVGPVHHRVEDVRDEYSPIRVLHTAVTLSGIADMGPILPLLSNIEEDKWCGAPPISTAPIRSLHAVEAVEQTLN